MQASKEERSLGELLGDLVADLTKLIRQEIQLATTEMGHKASRVGRDVGSLAVGGAVAYAGFLAIVGGVIVLLAQWVPLWASALVVGLVVAGIGYVMVQSGLSNLRRVDLTPRRTVETLKDDVEWAKGQTR